MPMTGLYSLKISYSSVPVISEKMGHYSALCKMHPGKGVELLMTQRRIARF